MRTRSAVVYQPETPTERRPIGVPAGLELLASEHGEQGLAAALRRIAEGEAEVLMVARLADAADAPRELLALIEWLAELDADLVALDVGLDTGSPGGRQALAVLRELGRWEREPPRGRPRRGRPGLAEHAPELALQIAAMRERGLSLQAIADALNDQRVPTSRGGVRWRPSSVQSALGYRRPGPRFPGAPPPPPVPRVPPPHRVGAERPPRAPRPAARPPGERPGPRERER
jgi:Resolvase, N terminal domain